MALRSRSGQQAGLALTFLMGCNLAPPIDIDSAVLVLPAGSAPAAMYFTVANHGNADVAVTAVTVEPAITAQLQSVTAHRMPGTTSASGERALMRAIDRVDVRRQSTVSFAPGGYTVVLPSPAAGSTAPWQQGDSVRFTVHLSSAWKIEGVARVVTFADFDRGHPLALTADTAEIASTETEMAAADEAARLALGRRLYRSNGCAHCHGLEGAGDGPLAATLQPPPRNFRAMPVFVNGRTPAAIARTLATGLRNGGAMPLYPHLNRAERLAVAHYVLSLSDSLAAPSDSGTPAAMSGTTINRSLR